jgi:hypothetical protein
MISWVRRHPVLGGFVAMFACTWPIDLWGAPTHNTSAVFLPILPAAVGDSRPMTISIGLQCAAAVAVVLAAGPARLSRTNGPVKLKTV